MDIYHTRQNIAGYSSTARIRSITTLHLPNTLMSKYKHQCFRVEDNLILMEKSNFEIGEKKFCTAIDQHAQPDITTPLQSVWSMALSDMIVGCEQYIYLIT